MTHMSFASLGIEGMDTPDKNPIPLQHPGQMNMPYEDIILTAEDGCRLHSWLILQKDEEFKTAPTIIFLQGNAGNIGLRMNNLYKLYENCKVNIMALSYRGYGHSTGTPTEKGVYLDAEAALDYICQREDLDKSKIFVFGRSVGGAVAINLASSRGNNIKGLIVENTFTSLKDMALILFPFMSRFFIRWIQRIWMNSIEKDALVPPSHTTRLYEASKLCPLRRIYKVAYGTHNDTWEAGTDYYKEISEFITASLLLQSSVLINAKKIKNL